MSSLTHSNQQTLMRLRWRWATVAVVWTAVWLLIYRQLHPFWPHATQWLLLSALGLGYGLWVLWRSLPQNHREGEPHLLDTFGIGNQITLLRGLMMGLLAGFLFAPWPMRGLGWFVVLLYTVAAIADYLDGYLARSNNHATGLGAILDMEFDGMGMLIVILLAVSFGQLPWWYLGLGLARYLFVFGLWWRKRQGLAVYDIHHSAHRRVFAGFQMGFMTVVLWPIIPRSGSWLAGTLFALPLALGFWRDWLVAIGRLDPTGAAYRRIQQPLYRVWAQWLPPLWRGLLLVCLLSIYRNLSDLPQPAAWVALFSDWRLPWPHAIALFAVVLGGFLTLAATLGIMTRLSAILLMLPLAFEVISNGLTWPSGVAVTMGIWLMLLGPGRWALWPVEERFVLRRLGGVSNQ
jgi:CDP-diacylglycerol--glycerol-3-phosphate 3-phosphatidyltransferase